MAFETILATVVIPAVVDLVKGGVAAVGRKFTGLSVEDQIKLANADAAKVEALAKLDNPGGVPSQWVVDLRASIRYILAAALVLVGSGLAGFAAFSNAGTEVIQLGLEIAAIPSLLVFGERMYLTFKK